jgi:queuosine precursor transporter
MNKMQHDNPSERQQVYRYYDVIMVTFVTVLIISNIASSAKIVDWGISIFGIPLAFDAGTLLFPISYIFGDILTEVYGYRRSRRVIWVGFAALALSALTLWVVRIMPGESQWQGYAGQDAYNAILGGMTSGGLVIASLTAYFVGEFSNSYILAKMKVLTRGRWLWMRTIGSTLVGEAIDSLIFIAIASLAQVFPWSLFVTLVVTNYIFKVVVEAAMTPVTYGLVSKLKLVEKEDYYDRETNFNPFQFKK